MNAETDVPPMRCSRCRHAPHESLGFCPNLASDYDCACPGAPAETWPELVLPPASTEVER